MWEKLWESVDGHDTGRWQWFTDTDVNAHTSAKVAIYVQISCGRRGCAYPGVWMPPEAICVPPGMGKCITNVEEVKKNQTLMSMR